MPRHRLSPLLPTCVAGTGTWTRGCAINHSHPHLRQDPEERKGWKKSMQQLHNLSHPSRTFDLVTISIPWLQHI